MVIVSPEGRRVHASCEGCTLKCEAFDPRCPNLHRSGGAGWRRLNRKSDPVEDHLKVLEEASEEVAV